MKAMKLGKAGPSSSTYQNGKAKEPTVRVGSYRKHAWPSLRKLGWLWASSR